MPTATFTTTFTLNSNASTAGTNPGISEDAVSFTSTITSLGNNDTGMGNVTLAANQSQSWYQPQGTAAQLPDITYAYVRAAAANSSSISILYTSGSTETTIAKLFPSQFMYAPIKVVSGSSATAASTSIKLRNDSDTHTATAYAIYVESASIAI